MSEVQRDQELGGLLGRFALAFLAVRIVSRRSLLRIFQVPGLILVPLVFLYAAVSNLELLKWGVFVAGFLTVAQFSFWGNYLPRVYPTHLRGTGEELRRQRRRANARERSRRVVTTQLANVMPGATPPTKLAYAAALVAFLVYFAGFRSQLLPARAARKAPGVSSTVHVRFLGSGDAFGSGGRLQASILIDTGGFRALVDCGTTTLIGLKRAAIDPATIDVIVVSHLHGDHFGGIPFFLLDAQFSRRLRPLLVGGPPGTADRLTQAMEVFFPGSSRVERKFETRVLELAAEVPSLLGSLTVTPYEVRHASGAPAYALRLEIAGRVIAYSGDAEWTDALPRAAAGSDLFICEAYFYEKRIPFHLDYRTLLEHRSEIRTKRLVLTHMSADMLSRLTTIEVEAASDGRSLEL